MPESLKSVNQRYLREARDALLLKVEGLSERELRLPRTPTGTNLLGIIKHCLSCEAIYFGETFGRPWPTPDEMVSEEQWDLDPQADWYATAEESAADILDLYRRVQAFGDETIDQLELDALGRVPHWSGERAEVTLGEIMVHVTGDLQRHAGHADILREGIDQSVGYRSAGDNVPDEYDWPAYVAKLNGIAERF